MSAQKRAEEGMIRALGGADPVFIRSALRVVSRLSKSGHEFTTDDVWLAMPAKAMPLEPRALGPVMRHLSQGKLIKQTGRYRASVRPESHGNPKAVWIGVPQGRRK
jgi:hypothetical protein